MSDIDRTRQASREIGTPIQHAAMLLSDADNRAYWRRIDAELNDLMEVVEDGGD